MRAAAGGVSGGMGNAPAGIGVGNHEDGGGYQSGRK